MVLALIFPWYTINITSDAIVLEKEEERHLINNDNFETFKTIFNMMFSFSKDESRDYNPSGEVAKRIAEKLKQRHQKLAELKEGKKKIDILSRYVSILAVGEHKDMNSLLNLSVYQLFDEFERFKLVGADAYVIHYLVNNLEISNVNDPYTWNVQVSLLIGK